MKERNTDFIVTSVTKNVTTIIPVVVNNKKALEQPKKRLTAKNYERLIPVDIEKFIEVLECESELLIPENKMVDKSVYNHFNISTITVQKNLDENYIENIINLEKLNEYLTLTGLICQSNTNKLPRKTFKNQTTITISFFYIKPRKVSLKIFNKGTLHLTGIPYTNYVDPICEIAKLLIQRSGSLISSRLSIANQMNYCNYKVCMINTIINIDMKVDLHLLKKTIMTVYNYYVSYEPKVYSGCNVKFMSKDSKEITLLIFSSGKLEITGSNSIYQLIEAYNFLKMCIIENPNCIKLECDIDVSSKFTIEDHVIKDIFVHGIKV